MPDAVPKKKVTKYILNTVNTNEVFLVNGSKGEEELLDQDLQPKVCFQILIMIGMLILWSYENSKMA